MDASKTEKMRILAPNLVTCQLATWAENIVKFELSNKKARENQTKRGGSGVGDTIKRSWEVWLKIESKHEPLW